MEWFHKDVRFETIKWDSTYQEQPANNTNPKIQTAHASAAYSNSGHRFGAFSIISSYYF